MGKYTVGLPKPGPNPREIWNRWVNVVNAHGPEMANNYLNAIRAVAASPAIADSVTRKLAAWFAAFYGAGVPVAYKRAIMPALERYHVEKARIAGAPVGVAVPAPAPAR